VTDPASGSNATDDDMVDVLEDDGNDPVAQEITALVNAMTNEEKIDLVALMRLGRGDGGIEEWDELWREARDTVHRPTRYLLGEPLVSDYLAEGLSAFGIDWADMGDLMSLDPSRSGRCPKGQRAVIFDQDIRH
jgi:hypothetical protein